MASTIRSLGFAESMQATAASADQDNLITQEKMIENRIRLHRYLMFLMLNLHCIVGAVFQVQVIDQLAFSENYLAIGKTLVVKWGPFACYCLFDVWFAGVYVYLFKKHKHGFFMDDCNKNSFINCQIVLKSLFFVVLAVICAFDGFCLHMKFPNHKININKINIYAFSVIIELSMLYLYQNWIVREIASYRPKDAEAKNIEVEIPKNSENGDS